MELHLPDLHEGYVALVRRVAADGEPVGPRGLATRELTNVTLVIRDPAASLLPLGVGRRVSPRLAAVEALQLVGGVARHDLVRRASPAFDDVLVDPVNATYGAYGPRLRQQLLDAVELLREDPATRRAVLAIWCEGDLTHAGDRPCTVFLQALVRDGKLELHSVMRSQDAWLGLAYDGFCFGQLRDTLAAWLGIPAGRWVHRVTSLHVYERDLNRIGELEPDGLGERDLSRGVHATGEPLEKTPPEAARALLRGAATPAACAANPWYVRQLTKLGVTQVRAEAPGPAA